MALRVYTASHCPGNARTQYLVAQLGRHRPHLLVQVIDLDQPGAEYPPFVIGTPTYVWGNRVIFWGNPSEADLLARLDEVQAL